MTQKKLTHTVDKVNKLMAQNGFKYGFNEKSDYYYSGTINKVEYINFHNKKAEKLYNNIKG